MRYARALYAVALPLLLASTAAHAGCGWNIACSVSEAFGRDATRGAVQELQPLITYVMEREAPALIAQLKEGVDHNILTAEQASDRLIMLAGTVIDQTLKTRGEGLIDYAQKKTEDAEKQFVADFGELLKANFDRLHCEILGMNALIENQQVILSDGVESWLDRLPFVGKSKNDVNALCRKDVFLPLDAKTGSLGLLTAFKLWECVRVHYVDENSPSEAILNAYQDMEQHGFGVVCALHSASPSAAEDAAKIWQDDGRRATAWHRAVNAD